MYTYEELLETAGPDGHLVQLYEADEPILVRNVTRYIGEGLKRKEEVLVIATADHRQTLLQELEQTSADPGTAMREDRLIFMDAAETLARLMFEGYPNGARFDDIIGAAVREAFARAEGRGLRVYGEMVGMLWKQRQFPAAIRLEQLWNKLRKTVAFGLFCSYSIDVFDKQFEIGVLDALLCAHTHLLPSGSNGDLESAINLAMDEVLGPEAEEMRPLIRGNFRPAWASIPTAESTILWLRHNIPDKADEILALARQYYRVSA